MSQAVPPPNTKALPLVPVRGLPKESDLRLVVRCHAPPLASPAHPQKDGQMCTPRHIRPSFCVKRASLASICIFCTASRFEHRSEGHDPSSFYTKGEPMSTLVHANSNLV